MISAVWNMPVNRILAKNYPTSHCLIPNFTEQAAWLLLNGSFFFKSYNLDLIIVVQIVLSNPVLVKFVLVVYRVSSWSSFALSYLLLNIKGMMVPYTARFKQL